MHTMRGVHRDLSGKGHKLRDEDKAGKTITAGGQ